MISAEIIHEVFQGFFTGPSVCPSLSPCLSVRLIFHLLYVPEGMKSFSPKARRKRKWFLALKLYSSRICDRILQPHRYMCIVEIYRIGFFRSVYICSLVMGILQHLHTSLYRKFKLCSFNKECMKEGCLKRISIRFFGSKHKNSHTEYDFKVALGVSPQFFSIL